MSTTLGRPYVSAPVPRMRRRIRRPVHNAYVHFIPWAIQPFLIAPVLPGETLKNLLFQARILTTPLANNQVIGWWIETYFFYVKHRHLANATTYTNMMIDMNTVITGVQQVANLPMMNSLIGDMQFPQEAYTAIVNEYFRGDGESDATAAGLIAGTGGGNLRLARLKMPGWWDSIIPNSQVDTGHGGIADDSIGGANTALDQVGEIGRALETWQQLRMLGITNLEYDDWLRSFGVQIAAPTRDVPELLRYTREWQYPSSAVSVDATAQRVSSVVSWSLTERADKDRYFREPGLIMGFVIARPKLYHDRQQAGVGLLQDALAWQTPFASGVYDRLRPVSGLTGYHWDTADLFNQGDQYRYIHRGTSCPTVAFPANGKLDYANATLINSLFTDGATGHVKMDATVSLQVATAAVGADITPTTV